MRMFKRSGRTGRAEFAVGDVVAIEVGDMGGFERWSTGVIRDIHAPAPACRASRRTVMCALVHDEDGDDGHYPVEILGKWKQGYEAWARLQVG
jgi:hypothetical protein